MKKTIYIDMDGVIADFIGEIEKIYPAILDLPETMIGEKIDRLCAKPENRRIFRNLKPIKQSIDSVKLLMSKENFDVYFLSTPMWHLPESFTDKRLWLEEHFGEMATKRLILTHRKDLNVGDYLIDDRTVNGVDAFQGQHIHFGTEGFRGWDQIMMYFNSKYFAK